MSTERFPVQPIDYTSRDYAAIREDLMEGKRNRVPEWTSENPNDFGVVLIELFAQMGDMLSFYADRIATEAYLPTATQRSSVLQLARLLDYRPAGNVAAEVLLTFTNTGTSSVVVPVGTQLSATAAAEDRSAVTLIYETQKQITLPARVGTVNGVRTVLAREGATIPREPVAVSNGGLEQRYPLFSSPVIDGSVRVLVFEAAEPDEWKFLEHIVDAGPLDKVFTTDTDENDVVYVVFGDGVNGKIPNPGAAIKADYRVGGGTIGNVASGRIKTLLVNIPNVSVSNADAAYGGGDAESIEQIRANAPQSLYSLDRAVTLQDYANLAIRVSNIAKARAVSSVPNSITVYVAPTGGGGLDSSGSPTPQFVAAKKAVQTYLRDKTAAAVTVTVGNPAYVKTNVTLNVEVLPTRRQDVMKARVIRKLAEVFHFDNVLLGDRITVSDIYAALAQVVGVDFSTITVLARQDTPPTPGEAPTEIRYASYEVPVPGTFTVTVTGGIA